MTAKSIIWLASYPKSGNTWTRAFIANYALNTQDPMPINEMRRFTFGDSMSFVYESFHKGPVQDLSEEHLLAIRERILENVAANGADMNFLKTHNINGQVHGHKLIPVNKTRLAIYILRNPLGVIQSYARHFGLDHDQTIYTIGHSLNCSVTNEKTVKEYMGSWSEHVSSWTGTKKFPVHVMRFEDMKKEPEKTFGKLVRRLGLPFDKERLDRAIRHSSFKELKRQEETYGFVEQSANSKSFFHSGEAESWKSQLTPEQISRVRQDHGKVMQKFGYF